MKPLKQAFTLIELMVAIGITSLLALVAFQFMNGLISVWNESDKNISLESESRMVLDEIAKDLESAFFANGQGTMFAVDVLSDNLNSGQWDAAASVSRPTANPFDPDIHRYGWAGSWLRFFTAAPSLNAVGYQIVRSTQMSFSALEGYHLYRGIVRSDRSSQSGMDLLGSAYAAGSRYPGYPIMVKSPLQEYIVASNVVDFGVRLYVYEEGATYTGTPAGMRLVFPVYNYGAGTFDVGVTQFAADGVGVAYPDAVEVYIRMLDSEGVGFLSDLEEAGSSTGTWDEIVAQHSKLFSRFITVKGKAL